MACTRRALGSQIKHLDRAESPKQASIEPPKGKEIRERLHHDYRAGGTMVNA
jgi:hypothetical protein